MNNQKYKKGDRVKVLVGSQMWTNHGKGNVTIRDTMAELMQDTATVEYTYGEKSETDGRFSKGEDGYKRYCLNFDKHGSIAWFDEQIIISAEDKINTP